MVDVCDEIGNPHDLTFERGRPLLRIETDRRSILALGVPPDPVANLPREIQTLTVVLEAIDHAQALLVMPEPAGHEGIEHALAGMTERRVSQIVPERDRLGELLVKAKHLRNRARDLRHLEAVCQSRAVMVARGREEDLRLVLQPAEGL